MEKSGLSWETCINWRVFLLFFLLVLICYGNTFDASFHFDDFYNITQNPKLQLKNLYPETIHDAIFGNSDTGRVFYRPVSNLTLAVNWYFGKTDVTGYHMVNIGIHILSTFFLYLAILSFFNTPNFFSRYSEDKYFIAVLAAALWAVNPIQTQAVTYIVQRMAAMAAMFYILGVYLYIKARTSHSVKKKGLLFAGFLFSFLLAVGSKENAIMLPVLILIIEMAFFHDMSNPVIRKKFIWLGATLGLTIFALSTFLFLNGDVIGNILEGYEKRTYTLSERLMTQPRVIIFYLTQIFYPIADRLSLDHDIVVSTGFFSPWTTLPAIFFILILTIAAFWQINKRPLFSFAILFFFINHIVESSIIPLELIFEHRNYLPSLFLFLPVAAVIKWMMNYYSAEKKIMEGLLIGFVTILITMLGLGTYIRNMAWSDEKTLWEDTIIKAPGRARAYQNLGADYYTVTKNYDKVLELSEKAMYLDDNTRHKAEVISLVNIANVYAKQKKNYEKIIEIYTRILSINPENFSAKYHLVLALIETGKMDKAMRYINQLLALKKDSVEYLNTKAFILLKQKKPEKAMQYLKKAIKIEPDDEKTLMSLGVAKSMVGQHWSAEHYFKRIADNSKYLTSAFFFLIENSIKLGDLKEAQTHAENLVFRFSSEKILNSLKQLDEGGLQWPLATDLIAPVIAEKLMDQSTSILEFRKRNGG